MIGHGYERYVGYLTTLGLFILVGCFIGLMPGFETADGDAFGAAGLRAGHLVLLPFPGHPHEWLRLHQEFSGTGAVAGAADVRHRSIQPSGAHSVAHHPSFCQYVCQRHGDPGVLLAGSRSPSR